MQEDLETVEDPVCGMEIDPGEAVAEVEYNGERWFFCSDECKRLFEANPLSYVEKAADEQNLETTTS